MRRRLLRLVAIGGIALAAAGCTPQQIAFMVGLSNATHHNHPTLVCIRRHESDTRGGYRATNGTHFGAYQFSQSTWDSTAFHMGRRDLAGRWILDVPWWDQDQAAFALLTWQGTTPWAGSGC